MPAAVRRARPLSRSMAMALIAAGIVLCAGVIGNLATLPNIPTWYVDITKPIFNPPNWVFGPVWSALYLLMAYAFWRVLILPASLDKKVATAWFVAQMILNAFWSVAFFGLHSPVLGLLVITLLIGAISITLIRFYRLDVMAGRLLIPYLLWVSFASVLNASIWWLNG
jgi:translocator protein